MCIIQIIVGISYMRFNLGAPVNCTPNTPDNCATGHLPLPGLGNPGKKILVVHLVFSSSINIAYYIYTLLYNNIKSLLSYIEIFLF